MNFNTLLADMHSIGLSSLEEKMPEITDEPKVPGFFCFANDNAIKKYNVQEVFGQGFDTNTNLARVKSVGEFLERLCLSNPVMERVKEKNSFHLGKSFVDPASFCCYSQEQLPNKQEIIKTMRNENYSWYPVLDLLTDEKKFVPAQMIFLSGDFDNDYPLRKEQTSSGAAFGHKNSRLSLKSGLLEIIERDASISSYLQKKKVPKITEFSGEIEKLLSYLKRYKLEVYVLDITNDLDIPTVMAITLDRTGIGDAVSVGSRSDIDYSSAIKGAILESIQCRSSSRINRGINGSASHISKEKIYTMNERFEYWASIDRLNDLDFWINSNKFVNYRELPRRIKSFEEILKVLDSKNYHVFVADISLPEIKQKGFECLKVIIPELHPLYLDERAKALYSVHHGEIKNIPTLKPHPLT